MARLPEFLLRALYVKGSLQNTADGFQFQMKNDLGPARIIGAGPLQLDRKPVAPAACTFEHEGRSARFADVDAENSVLMRKGEALTVHVQGQTLQTGRRTLGINVVVKDLGDVRFTVTDQVR